MTGSPRTPATHRRGSHPTPADERREQAVARAGAYLARWADSDPHDTRALERAELALREALAAQ